MPTKKSAGKSGASTSKTKTGRRANVVKIRKPMSKRTAAKQPEITEKKPNPLPATIPLIPMTAALALYFAARASGEGDFIKKLVEEPISLPFVADETKQRMAENLPNACKEAAQIVALAYIRRKVPAMEGSLKETIIAMYIQSRCVREDVNRIAQQNNLKLWNEIWKTVRGGLKPVMQRLIDVSGERRNRTDWQRNIERAAKNEFREYYSRVKKEASIVEPLAQAAFNTFILKA